MFVNRRRIHQVNDGNSGQMMYGNSSRQQWNNGYARNFPPTFPYPSSGRPPLPRPDWQPYQSQNPYYPQQYQPLNQAYHPYAQHGSYHVSPMQKDSQFLFQNPLQPQEEIFPYQNPYPQMNGFINPYPKHHLMPKQPGGMHSIMNSFKSQDGSVDFNKMMNTAGQMMNAVTQVSSLVKGLGGMFKV